MKLLQVWGCDYCSMVSRYKTSVARHEIKSCRKNPARKTCGRCAFKPVDSDELECVRADFVLYEDRLNDTNQCSFFAPIA